MIPNHSLHHPPSHQAFTSSSSSRPRTSPPTMNSQPVRRLQAHPPSPQTSFASDGDGDEDTKNDVNMDVEPCRTRRKGKERAKVVDDEDDRDDQIHHAEGSRSSRNSGGDVNRTRSTGSLPPTHAQNGLMSPPTPAPSPTPGRNGWWGTVPRGPTNVGAGAEEPDTTSAENRHAAGACGSTGIAGETSKFDPQQLLDAFPSLPPPTRLALINGLLPMLTTPELLMLSSHIGPRLKRDFLRDLPQELALHVLSFVDDPRALARAACVSRYWRKLLEDEKTWKDMCERHRLHPTTSLFAAPSLPLPVQHAAPPPPLHSGMTTTTTDSIDSPGQDIQMADAESSSRSVVIPSSTNGVTPAFGITGPEMFVASRVRRDSGIMEDGVQQQPGHGFPVYQTVPPGATTSALPVVSAPNQPAAYILGQTGQPTVHQPQEGQINGQLPPLPSVVAPGAAALSTARRSGLTGPTRGSRPPTEQPRMTNVRGDAFGLGSISKRVKEDGFSYKTAFKKAYLTESNWLRGGRLLSSHTSADDGVVTSLAVDSNYIIIGMANSKVHVFTANGGVFLRTLMGHTLGVWCLTLISEGGGSPEAVVEDDSMELSSDDEGSGGGLFDPKILKAFRDSDKKGSTSKINLPKSTAAKSRKRARPSHAGRRSSHDAIGPDAATTLSGLGGTTASSPDFVIPGRNRPINFNFAASPPSAARYQTDPETPPGGDDEAAGPSHRARRMEQSDVCGAARGWGQKNPVVISGGCDRDVRVWDLNTGFCHHILRGHTSTIRCLKAIDGRPIAVSGSRDATLKVWDIEKGQLLHSLVGHQHSVRCIEIAGNQVVSGSYDCTCRIWDVDTGECLQVLRGHYHQIYAVAFDGERVATGSLDSTVRIWSAATGDCVALLQGHTSLVGQLQLSGDTLVTGGSDGRVIIFDLVNYTCLQRICAHDNSVTCLQFDERFIVSGGNDGRVKLWDIKTGHFIRELSKPCEAVWRVTFRDDKCAILCKRNGKTILEVLSFVPDEEEVMGRRSVTAP